MLIFDEVVTGFRIAPGGAQEYFGVTADIVTFAKAIANGYALSVVVEKKEIMESQKENFFSSTYWSDTTTIAAGLATLTEIKTKPVIATMDRLGCKLIAGLQELGRKYNLRFKAAGPNCDFCIGFDYGSDSGKVLTLYMQEMIARGIYVSGVVYTCFTHNDRDIDKILAAADESFAIIKQGLQTSSISSLLKCPERQVGFRRLV